MVSIIIPLYNGEAFIKKTISSALNQTYEDIEVIVINDKSTDKSLDEVKLIRDKRLILINNDNNIGFCRTANVGIKFAKGEYVIVLGQDDILESCHVSEMVKCMKDGVSLVTCNYSLIDENDIEYEIHKDTPKLIKTRNLIRRNVIHSCGVMMRKDILDTFGGYPEFRQYPQFGEWYLWIKLIELGSVVKCESVLPKYRRHKANMTNGFTSISTRIKLEEYWNKCRILAIKSRSTSFKWKIIGFAYVILNYFKIIYLKVLNFVKK